jgi:transposase-like protein
MTRGAKEDGSKRYYRHGESFWRDLIARQPLSGQGVRKFCQANGVASGTFHKWRATLGKGSAVIVPAPVATPDAMFIALAHESDGATSLPPEPSRAPSSRGGTRDSVIVTSGGMRVEMTGAHADRIVRHLLSRMNGFTC